MTSAARPARCTLYDAPQLDAVLDTMARRAAALFPGDAPVALVGIVRRGLPLAERLRERLQDLLPAQQLPVFPLELKRYADDLTLLHPGTLLKENADLGARQLSDTRVLLVDDVLYGGYSLLRAAGWLAQAGAAEIRTAVLVDRGVSRLPVRADITGLRLDVAPGDIVECHVPPYEPALRIDVCRGGAS